MYNFAFLLSYVLAGSGMYLLAKSLTGSRSAAVLAGVAFAFAPYRVAQAPHLQVLNVGLDADRALGASSILYERLSGRADGLRSSVRVPGALERVYL